MNLLSSNKQAAFFDKEQYQYSEALLMNPPFHTQREINAVLGRLPEIKKDEEVVDFGAGSGRIAIPLLKKKIPVLALDVSKKSLAILIATAKRNKLTGLTTSSEFPKDKSFTAIVGADILHHISLDTYLPIFYKSLRKGGKVIFSEPNAFNPFWYLILPVLSSWEIEKGMLSCTRQNLINKFKKFGFRDIKISGFCLFPGPIFNFSTVLCIANEKAGNLPVLRKFSYRLIIEASK